jgi:hypothetical protein
MEALRDAYPRALSYEELTAAAGGEDAMLQPFLKRAVVTGVVAVHSAAAAFTPTPGDRPRAGSLVRALAAEANWTIGLHHTKVPLTDDVVRLFLLMCDGTRTIPEIAAAMSEKLGGTVVPEEKVSDALRTFASVALFEA